MDIKPPNFITVCGKMKVIDLGCAEQIPEGKEYLLCRTSKGTEGYMGPECTKPIEGKHFQYSLKTDSYSLGVVLTFLLSKTNNLEHYNNHLSVYLKSVVQTIMNDEQLLRKSAKEMYEYLRN